MRKNLNFFFAVIAFLSVYLLYVFDQNILQKNNSNLIQEIDVPSPTLPTGRIFEMDVSRMPISINMRETFPVVAVIDGDTIRVKIADKIEVVRLIGIDTPETVDRRKTIECFGREATEFTRITLFGKNVILERDDTQGDRDRYNRLLRFVFTEDGTNFNLKLIKQGFAYEYTYNLPYKYQAEFKEAERVARQSQIGLWAEGVCNEVIED